MKPVVILDLDKTIFNTELFWLNAVSALNNIVAKEYIANNLANKYSSYYKDGSHYTDFSSLLSDNNVDIKVLANKIKVMYPFSDFLLPDSYNLLKYLDEHEYMVQILTIGDKEYQKLKVIFCPKIQKYKVDIISYAKYKYINLNYKNTAGVLIDDKPNQHLRSDWYEIYVNRSTHNIQKYTNNKKNVLEVDKLDKVPIILETIYGAKS